RYTTTSRFCLHHPAPPELYTLSLHDALPILAPFIPTFQRPSGWSPAADIPIPTDFVPTSGFKLVVPPEVKVPPGTVLSDDVFKRSEEHTSELQSRENLVCRLLLEKKNKKQIH